MPDKPEALVYQCSCGQTYFIAPFDGPKVCDCGVRFQWEPKVRVWVKSEDGEWCDPEDTCDGCGAPMLDAPEPQPYIDVTLCAKCGGGRELTEEEKAANAAEER